MPSVTLHPSGIDLNDYRYSTVTDTANAYNSTSNTSYCRMSCTTGNQAVSYRYWTFDTSSIPSTAQITSVTAKVKTAISSTSYLVTTTAQLCTGTTMKGEATSTRGTSGTVYTMTPGSWTRTELNDLRLYIYCKRGTSSTNRSAYHYLYGADVTIEYSVGDPRTITSTLTGEGTISPSGASTYYDGDTYTLTITPDDFSETVTVKNNGTDVSSQVTAHYPEGTPTTVSKTAGSFTTGYSTSNIAFYTSSSSSGNNFNYAVGHTAESPGSTSSGSGSWTYVKNPNSSSSVSGTGWADFSFDFSDIPSNAVIESVTVECYGAVESSSQSTSHADITLYSGSTQKGTMQKFTSSTNRVITISDVGTWTRAELQSAKLRFTVGYYGGHIFGITWSVTYSIPSTTPDYYVYSYTVNGNAAIAVTIGPTTTVYLKVNGSWIEAVKVYKKVSGSWVEQIDLENVFDSNVNYVKG